MGMEARKTGSAAMASPTLSGQRGRRRTQPTPIHRQAQIYLGEAWGEPASAGFDMRSRVRLGPGCSPVERPQLADAFFEIGG